MMNNRICSQTKIFNDAGDILERIDLLIECLRIQIKSFSQIWICSTSPIQSLLDGSMQVTILGLDVGNLDNDLIM